MKQYHSTNRTVTVENYPYGYHLKTTLTHSVEFKSGKGFRHVTQTINPKTGRLNNPKRGTYYPIMLLGTDSETNYTRSHVLNPNSAETVNIAAEFMRDKYYLFQHREIVHIATHLLTVLKADTYCRVAYCGSEASQILPYYTQAVEALVKIVGTGSNHFEQVHVDTFALDALKVENFQPFTAVQ
jgi:hypothetical protein